MVSSFAGKNSITYIGLDLVNINILEGNLNFVNVLYF